MKNYNRKKPAFLKKKTTFLLYMSLKLKMLSVMIYAIYEGGEY